MSHVPWTPFEQATDMRMRPEDAALRKKFGRDGTLVLVNSRYQVEAVKLRGEAPLGDCIWLSFKTRDKSARHDWREIQRIKNEIVGPHVEAVELYPDEDRLVDTSNQYHLWCFPWCVFAGHAPGRLPFGYRERLIGHESDAGPGPGARQRPFEETPPDSLTIAELRALGADPSPLAGRCPVCGAGFRRVPGGFECAKGQHRIAAP